MPTKISALTSGTQPTGTEQFEAVQSGASVKLTAAQVRSYATLLNVSPRSVANAFSETFGATDDVIILTHSNTLASGTVTMPASPLNGKVVYISSQSTVTNLTVAGNTGQTVYGGLTTIAASAPAGYVYNSANTSWYRIA